MGLLTLGVACGDSGTGGAGGSGASGGAGGAGGDGAAGPGGSGGSMGIGGTDADISVNEVQPHDDEWVEIANTTDAAVDLEGWGLCDEDAAGECDLPKLIRFPAGTSIAPGGHLLIVTDQDPVDGVGPHAACLGGVSECYYAPWKISAADGETIRLVDPSDEIVDALTYPPNATSGATESWSRLPDGSGAPGVGIPTPGAPNAE